MKNLALFVLLIVALECNAHLSQLTGILSGAHKHVHDVAGTILGGLNLNFQGNIGIGQRQPNRPQQIPGQQETIIVVVDETGGNGQHQHHGDGSYNNNHPRPGYDQGQWNGNNNGNTPQNPNGNNQNNYGNHNYGNPNPNNYGNNNCGDCNQNNYQQPNQDQNYNHQNPDYANQNNYMRPNGQNQNNYQQTTTHKYFDQNHHGESTTKAQEEQRPTGSIHEPTEHPTVQTDKSLGKDEPLFIPLNPNEYIYGGDKISINGPKRETDGDSKADDDSYNIDIRFQDQ